MKDYLRQCKIVSDNQTMITYLDDRKDLKVGAIITLKDVPDLDRRWKVVTISEAVPKESITSKRPHEIFKKDFIRKNGGYVNVK